MTTLAGQKGVLLLYRRPLTSSPQNAASKDPAQSSALWITRAYLTWKKSSAVSCQFSVNWSLTT